MHPVYFLSHYSSTYDDNNSIKSFIYNKYIHHTLSFLNFFLSFLNTTYSSWPTTSRFDTLYASLLYVSLLIHAYKN